MDSFHPFKNLFVIFCRSSDPRIASVNRMMMSKLSLREGNEENVLNHRFKDDRSTLTRDEWDRPGRPSVCLSVCLCSVCVLVDLNYVLIYWSGSQNPVPPSADPLRVTFTDPCVTRPEPAPLSGRSIEDPKRSRTAAEMNFTPHPGYKNTQIRGQSFILMTSKWFNVM